MEIIVCVWISKLSTVSCIMELPEYEPKDLIRASASELPLKWNPPGVMCELPLQTLRQSFQEIATKCLWMH